MTSKQSARTARMKNRNGEPWQALEIAGDDARDFLHRLTTADFRKAREGFYSQGSYLQHTGKFLAYFKALAVEDKRFLLFTPQPVEQVREAFEKMHFAEKLSIRTAPEWAYYRVTGETAPGLDALIASPRGTTLRLESGWAIQEDLWNHPVTTHDPSKNTRFDLGLVVPESTDVTGAFGEALEETQAERLRILAGEPNYPGEINDKTMPLEAGADAAVHENKGCYPGQEVIERIQSMGQSPRKLAVVEGTGAAPSVPSMLADTSGVDAGTVSSAVAEGKNWIGLVLLKKTYAAGNHELFVQGQPVRYHVKSAER